MLDVGFNAKLATTSWPEEIPPRIPPALLESKPSGYNSSRCSEPRCSTQSKPAPTSTPLTALMLIKALAISASSSLNTGSPKPTGMLLATTVILAPTESPSRRSCVISASISGTLDASGQLNGLFDTSSKSTDSAFTWPI